MVRSTINWGVISTKRHIIISIIIILLLLYCFIIIAIIIIIVTIVVIVINSLYGRPLKGDPEIESCNTPYKKEP